MFKNITVKGKEYQLRLTIKNIMALESALNTNPINILINMQKGIVPKISELVTILHFCLQELNHNISMDETQRIFEDYLSEGKTIFDVSELIAIVLKDSGLVGKN